MEAIKNIISIGLEILGGQPLFKGTRVPVDTLFMHLEQGVSLNDFLEDFPTVLENWLLLYLNWRKNW